MRRVFKKYFHSAKHEWKYLWNSVSSVKKFQIHRQRYWTFLLFFFIYYLYLLHFIVFLKTCFFRIIDTACNAWHDVTITCCKYQKCYFHSERYHFHSMDIYRTSHVLGFDIISNDLFVFYPQALARALKTLNKLGYEQFIQWVISSGYDGKYVIKSGILLLKFFIKYDISM